jgi:hypothetical protein
MNRRPTTGAPESPLAAFRLLDVGPATPASARLARGARKRPRYGRRFIHKLEAEKELGGGQRASTLVERQELRVDRGEEVVDGRRLAAVRLGAGTSPPDAGEGNLGYLT